MSFRPETAFDSIESAHEYLTLLGEVIEESRCEVDADCAFLVSEKFARRRQAMQIVAYKLARLDEHLGASRRILNDLRLLRRLLLAPRQPAPSESGLPRRPLLSPLAVP